MIKSSPVSLFHCRLVSTNDGTPIDTSKKQQLKPHTNLWDRNIRKQLRQMGESYIDSRGRPKDGRTIGPSCPTKCHYECSLNFDDSERARVFKYFWSLTAAEKNEFYTTFIVIINVKRKRKTTKDATKRTSTFCYYLPFRDRRLQVCQVFFRNTLGISTKMIYRVFKKC